MMDKSDIEAAKEFIRLHSKRCPYCKSTEASTIDAFEEDPNKMRHRCCNCNKIFTDAEALPSIASENPPLQVN